MPRKTISDYKADVKKLYSEVQLLKAYCEANPDDLETKKELDKKRGALKRSAKALAKKCDPFVYVARNEGIPWKSEDMPWSDTGRNVIVKPMPLKKDTKIKQVGDYICYIPELGVYYPKVIDRKSWDDMNSTFVDEDNRDRFFREVATFNEDPRFKDIPGAKLEIFAECTKYDFLAKLAPYPMQCKFCTKVHRDKIEEGFVYYCTDKDMRAVRPESSCKSFDPHKRSDVEVMSLIKKKRTVLGQLKKAGVEVCWQGSRFEASHQFTVDIFEWVRGNYVTILKLDAGYNDRVFLEKKILQLETELEAARSSLLRYELCTEEVRV